MNPTLPVVIAWMKFRGFRVKVGSDFKFYKTNWAITEWVSISSAFSDFCHCHNEHWTDSEGNILNELGKPAKKGDIILREFKSGYPVQRFGYERIKGKEEITK